MQCCFQDLAVLWKAKSSRVVVHPVMPPVLTQTPCALQYVGQAVSVPVAMLLTNERTDVSHWTAVQVSEL